VSIVRVGLGELVLRSDARPGGELVVRSGAEAADLTEALYVGLLAVALWGMQVVCAMSVVIAFVRTDHANFARTTMLAVVLSLLSALALRSRVRYYRAMRRWPLLSLSPPAVSLVALVIDGVSHSPMSYPASVGIAMTAFVHGRRWALVAATLVSVGAIAAAMLNAGLGALNSVGQGAAGYFVWALVCAGLAESFVLLILRLPQPDPSPSPPSEPVRVPNLGGDPGRAPADPPAAQGPSPPGPRSGPPSPPARDPALQGPGHLTARQLQVVALLADGMRAEEVAAALSITTSAVYRHVERAKERTGVRTRGELVAIAVRETIVPAT
jgi:DNA-binding CsgD family transcriptional regulator